MKTPSVVIATPTYDNKVISGYVGGITRALQLMQERGWTTNLAFVSGTFLEIARSECAELFFTHSDADYLMFIDADMGFEGESVLALIDKAIESGAPILAAPGPRRNVFPIQFPVKPPVGETRFSPNKFGICRAERVGTAFMAIHRKVIEALRKSESVRVMKGQARDIPMIFEMMWRGGELLPEDYAFCVRAAEAGFPTYLMQGIELLHEGSFGYTGAWSAELPAVVK